MSKKKEIRKLVKDIEAITQSKVIGFDFIALGDDDGYFYQDYLLHSRKIDAYLKFLDDNYFKNNPSLLLLKGLKEKIKSVTPSDTNGSKRIKLFYKDPKISKDNFTKGTTLNRTNEYYWNVWCNTISKFYPNCNSIYFIKLSFGSLDQTTALFIYFNTDISTLNYRRKGWLSKASKAFLHEEAVSVFLPKRVKEIEEQKIADLIQTTYSLGHNLKNRLLDSDKHMDRLIKYLNKSSLNGNEKSKITRYATNVSLKVKSLSNTGMVLDLIGRFMTERKWQEKSLTKNDYNLIDKFTTGELYQMSISGKYAKINTTNLPKILKIKGWLGGEYKRPKDFVYEELFFELFVNALTYGRDYEQDDKYLVDISISYEGDKIVMLNSIHENDKK